MREYLISFLKLLEARIPPARDAHHSLNFGRYGSDNTTWDDRLCLNLRVADYCTIAGERTIVLFIDSDDFEMPPAQLVEAVVPIAERAR